MGKIESGAPPLEKFDLLFLFAKLILYILLVTRNGASATTDYCNS